MFAYVFIPSLETCIDGSPIYRKEEVREDTQAPSSMSTTPLQRPSVRTSGFSKRKLFVSIWLPLFGHLALSIAITLLVALGVNGYHALAYSEQKRTQANGSYITSVLCGRGLWAGDVDSSSWSTEGSKLASQLSEVLGGLPWFKLPRGREWLVALIFAFILPQSFIEPLFSGSVDWNFALDYAPATTVRSGDPTASSTKWYYYNIQGVDRKTALRRAGGMASIAWGATGSTYSKGGSISAPGGLACRHLMPTTAPVSSTLANATLPCIYIHNIGWSDDQPPDDVWEYAWSKTDALSTFGDSLFAYVRPGVAVAFSQDLWAPNSTVKTDRKKGTSTFPKASKWSGNMTVLLLLGRQTSVSCKPIYGTAFGNSSYLTKSLPGVFQANANAYDENCMVWGTVYFTAGEI
ncbi:hypothetical protein FVEG_03651 [Fusarium verticillioides 7600]|uniref:Uncharacterized protein n=1 Tax=Gibberella moniliformis (strain M3125 / FGSC 7600) TaxID=334819 RepID=W7LQT6_GIBM7|nr:hypothetical protein FVEG_03651 [Fusarium verticillioides 7600]EWG41563.1 hypothetical protein FVEG_03651 [Fusarium verticillioides 7600]